MGTALEFDGCSKLGTVVGKVSMHFLFYLFKGFDKIEWKSRLSLLMFENGSSANKPVN